MSNSDVMTRSAFLSLRLWLCLLLSLTSVQLAVARGLPGAAGYAELCLNGAPVMVAVDDQGRPTGAAHVCPDMALSLIAALALPWRADHETFAVRIPVQPVARAAQIPSRSPEVRRARAPPVPVLT